jgi:hypothetical protein
MELFRCSGRQPDRDRAQVRRPHATRRHTPRDESSLLRSS